MNNQNVIECVRKLFYCVANDNNLLNNDKKEIHSFLMDTVKKFSDYISATNVYVFTVQSITELRSSGVIGQYEFERQLNKVDTIRKGKHDLAIDSCNQLNRLCDKYNISHVCDIDSSDRLQVAKFTERFSMEAHEYAISHNYTVNEILQEMEDNPRLLDLDSSIELD